MKNSFTEKKKQMFEEFDSFYSAYPADVSDILDRLDEEDRKRPDRTPYQLKAMQYRILSENCRVKVFRRCPFYFEIVSGIARGRLGAKLPLSESGFGSWIIERNRSINDPFVEFFRPYEEGYFLHSLSKFFDVTHIIPGYENVFACGLNGLKNRILERLAGETDPERIDLYEAMIEGLDAGMLVAEKFAEEAERMLKEEKDPEVVRNLTRIRDSASRCPKEAPRTFYEALNTYWFIHELLKIFDCLSIATIGHIDRELISYYRNDISKGILTREEAEDLIRYYLLVTDGIFDYYEEGRDHLNANMALTIGGQNPDGSPVYNEITSIVLKAMSELKLVNPNVSVRVSAQDDPEYFKEIAAMIASGCNNYSIINDDTAIPSLVRAGIPLEDARIYGTGGCQETVVPNRHHFMRAFMYINLPMLFNMSLNGKEEDREYLKKLFPLEFLDRAGSYEEVYRIFLKNFREYCLAVSAKFREYAPYAKTYNPLPLYSTTVDDCIDKGKDYTDGGARFYNASISLVGVGTLIDMLYTIRTEVFEKRNFTLKQLSDLAMNNFEGPGEERTRQYLVNRVKKYGNDDEELNLFAAKVFHDLAELSSGMDDGFGGSYVASLFSYNWYAKMGFNTEATLDGRKAGKAFSRSIGPSEYGKTIEISKAIHSISRIDSTEYPGITVLYLDMPYTRNRLNTQFYVDLLRYFMISGGYVLQLNIVDRETLIAAREEPDKYRSLVVRVCGFSEYFVSLKPERQDEMISRNEASG